MRGVNTAEGVVEVFRREPMFDQTLQTKFLATPTTSRYFYNSLILVAEIDYRSYHVVSRDIVIHDDTDSRRVASLAGK